MGKLNAAVLSLNDFIKVAMITTHGCNYCCPAKIVDGKWFFKFKNDWHVLDDYTCEFTRIISNTEKGLIERKY